MTDSANPKDFARTLGDELGEFLRRKGMKQSEAAKRAGLAKARLNTYCHDSPRGTRPTPDAETLYRLCANLGFEFEYNGYTIGASTLINGRSEKVVAEQTKQLPLEFDGQFNLTNPKGTVSVSFRRPPGRVEVSVSLKVAS